MRGSLAQMVLGLLLDAPAHGYELRRCLAPFFGAEGPLNAGLFYPTLAELERRRWVRKRTVTQRGAPHKHVYTVTAQGTRELVAWLRTTDTAGPVARYDFFHRDPLLARVMFFRHLPGRARRAVVEAELARATARRRDYTEVRSGMRRRGADRFRVRILELGLAYERLRTAWMRRLLRDIGGERGRSKAPRRRRRKGK